MIARLQVDAANRDAERFEGHDAVLTEATQATDEHRTRRLHRVSFFPQPGATPSEGS
jgi:hypothetical protein